MEMLMLESTPSWLSSLETLSFVVVILAFLYNRIVNWRKFNERTAKLELSFEQYQKDIATFFKTCEMCRVEVRAHHEDVPGRHVTPDLRRQIESMASEISEIKSFLIANK